MADTLATTLTLRLEGTYVNALDLSNVTDALSLNYSDTTADGTGLDQADIMWHDSRTLAATSEDLDLAGTLTGSFGTTVTFAKVKGILIKNTSTTATEILSVGGAAGNQFVNWVSATNDEINIGPNGVFLLFNPSAAGYAVTAGTGDLLKIDAGADTITYEITVWGTTA